MSPLLEPNLKHLAAFFAMESLATAHFERKYSIQMCCNIKPSALPVPAALPTREIELLKSLGTLQAEQATW